MNAWRQKQQAIALEAARSEEERLAAFWKRDVIKLWEHEAKLWKAHVQLAERHESHIATLEQKRAEVDIFPKPARRVSERRMSARVAHGKIVGGGRRGCFILLAWLQLHDDAP